MPVENPLLLCPPPHSHDKHWCHQTLSAVPWLGWGCKIAPGWESLVQSYTWWPLANASWWQCTVQKSALWLGESYLTQVHTVLQIRYDLSEPWQCSLLWFSRCHKIGGPLRRGSYLGHLTVSVWAEEELYRFLSATTKSLLHRRFNLLCSHHPLITSWERIERACDRMNPDSFCFVSVHVYTFH